VDTDKLLVNYFGAMLDILSTNDDYFLPQRQSSF